MDINNSSDHSRYNELLAHIKQGREIEFLYQGQEYFISKSIEGRALWNGKTQLSQIYKDDDDALNFIEVNGKKLKDLFKESKVVIQTIF